MAVATTFRRDVDTTLNFFKPNADGSPPAPAYMARPETFERPQDTRTVTVQDVTEQEGKFSLDVHGFQFVHAPSREKRFTNKADIKDIYYTDIERMIKDLTGATRVFVFDHTIRRPNRKASDTQSEIAPEENVWVTEEMPVIPPTHSVHVDQSYEAALSRVAHHLPDEAERLCKGRVQLINIWRPIKTVKRDPLTVSPSFCFSEDDLVPITVVYPQTDRTGATLGVKHNDRQQWYYKANQTPDEALVFKCFDNRAGAQSSDKYKDRAKRVPHSAFEIPGTEDEEPRESIEVRCLAFHEDDEE